MTSLRESERTAAGIFVFLICGFAAGLHEDVTDLYRDREAEIAALVFSDRLRGLYGREERLVVDRCKKLPRARDLREVDVRWRSC